MAWILQAFLPAGSSFDGQIVYGSPTIEIPDDLIRYIESIDISETPKYINKYTGGESKKYRIANSSGDDINTEISIALVSKLPRYLFNILFSLASAINQGGMQLYFRDTIVSDYIYSCRWINTADFSESNVLVGNCSINLLSWEKSDNLWPE